MGMLVVGLYHSAAAAVFTLDNACDVLVAAAKGDAAIKTPKLIEATPGTIIMLTGDSLCDPVIGPVFDKRTKRTVPGLVSGDGIKITAPGLILDLNGHNTPAPKTSSPKPSHWAST